MKKIFKEGKNTQEGKNYLLPADPINREDWRTRGKRTRRKRREEERRREKGRKGRVGK